MLRLVSSKNGSRAAVFAALLLLLGAVGCGKEHEPNRREEAASAAVPVRVQSVQAKPVRAFEEVMGTVRSKLRASVEAKVTARIETMLVVPGQTVNAGDLLVQLDTREIQAKRDQALPVLRNSELELKRFRSLVEQSAVSQSEFDASDARFRVAQAAVSEAETMLGYTKITAPFAGVITRKLADVGDLASPGRALLEVEDPRVLRVEADVPESLIDGIKMSEQLRVTIGAQSLNAAVSEIAPAADAATRTFLVKLDLPEQTGLRAGRFARLAIPLSERMALRVPATAVSRRGQMELAFVADGAKARLRLVKTGKQAGDEVEIVSGLAAGDRIVVEGASDLRDGQTVEVKP